MHYWRVTFICCFRLGNQPFQFYLISACFHCKKSHFTTFFFFLTSKLNVKKIQDSLNSSLGVRTHQHLAQLVRAWCQWCQGCGFSACIHSRVGLEDPYESLLTQNILWYHPKWKPPCWENNDSKVKGSHFFPSVRKGTFYNQNTSVKCLVSVKKYTFKQQEKNNI